MPIIDKGKIVLICMSHNNCFSFQTSPKFQAKILHYPQDTGDSWLLALEDGSEIMINPCSKDFIGFEIEDEPTEK